MSPSTRLAGAALAAALLWTGCETRGALGEQCQLNSQCDTPLVCRLARCRQQCASTRDCPLGQLCSPDARGLGACLLPDELSCAADDGCPGELVCRAGRCTVECAADRDCGPGARCVLEGDGGYCEDSAEAPCRLTSDCPAPLVCGRDRRCRDACLESRDCREGARCEQGRCVPVGVADGGPGADAGPDGGARDAGLPPPGPPCDTSDDCPTPEGVALAECVAGRCRVGRCQSGRAACDGTYASGCETPTASDPLNCGGCGIACGLAGQCQDGFCASVIDVALGPRHFCVARNLAGTTDSSPATVLCMGANDQGQLGRGTTSAFEAGFAPVVEESMRTPAFVDVDGLFAGPDVTCVRGPRLQCFGDNAFGQQGRAGPDASLATASSRASDSDALLALGGAMPRDAERLPTGPPTDGFLCGARAYGGVLECWGSATLQDDFSPPRAPGSGFRPPLAGGGGTGVTSVAAGGRFACAAWQRDVYCFGESGPWTGQASTGGLVGASTRIDATAGAIEVTAGDTHACARLDDGAVRCWGESTAGEVGVAAGARETTAVAVSLPGPAIALAASATHTCAIVRGGASGEVWCWGANGRGQLGDGTRSASVTPVRAAGLAGAVKLTLAVGRSCALREDFGVWCWGGPAEDYGVVGDSAAWTVPTPHPDFPGAP